MEDLARFWEAMLKEEKAKLVKAAEDHQGARAALEQDEMPGG